MKKVTLLLSVILLSSVSLIAKTNSKEVSNTELANFAKAYVEVQNISQDSQQKMVKVIQDEGLDVQRYNAIVKAQQTEDKDFVVTQDELDKIQVINSQLIVIDTETKEAIQKKITASSLTLESYQEIMEAVQSDEELQKKLHELLQS